MNRVLWLAMYSLTTGAAPPAAPRFEDFPVNEAFEGTPSPPILATPEQRNYRTRIRNGVAKGEGVWSGSWKNPTKGTGPNFAGHYFAIRWGCGSQCLMMAVVDAKTGQVHGSPLRGSGTELFVNMDLMGDRDIDFQRQSSLMILRNACKKVREECGIYYFNWENNHFELIQRTLIDLPKTR